MKASRKQWGDHRPDCWSPEWMPPPTHGTRRRPERKTYGGAVARTAAQYGTALFPAQRYVVDVAHERDTETDLMAYSTITALLHRQFGKTRGITWPTTSTRCELFEDQDCVYLAQDKNNAKAKWRDDYIAKLEASEEHQKGRDFDVRWEIGSEQLKFMPSMSTLEPGAILKQSGHGGTRDLVFADEAWWHDSFAVDSGYRVPMITRREVHPGAQMWIVSAAGTLQRSVYFIANVEKGRAAAAADTGAGRAHFEWSAPIETDIEDRSLWWYYIPALGHTISEAAIASDLEEMDETEWRRAYASQFTDESSTQSKLAPDVWARGTDPDSHIEGRAMVGVAVTPNRAEASIAIAGIRADGHLHVDHVKTGSGTGWVVDDVATVISNWPGVEGVAFDGGGPASALAWGELPTQALSVREFGQACAAVADGVGGGGLFHRGQVEFADAVARLQVRPLGDLWLPRRGDGDGSVAAFEAAAVAVGGLTKSDEPEPERSSAVLDRGGLFQW